MFRKRRFGGDCHEVTRSHGNLRTTPVGYRTRSLRMTSPHDRVLLFSKKMYSGHVIFARGVQDVANSAKVFFKPIRAIRVDPFTLHLNVGLVRRGVEYPGSWSDEADALASIDAAINLANRIWGPGMLWLERRRTEVREAPRSFDLRWPFLGIPSAWRRPGMVDVVFVNKIGRGALRSRLLSHVSGGTIVLARMRRSGEVSDERMGYCLAHELGHYLGIARRPRAQDPRNLMYRGEPVSLEPAQIHLSTDQIARVHARLAARSGRKAHRHN